MIEVYPNIIVCSEDEYEWYIQRSPTNNYKGIIHACKEPYHRNRLGYNTKGAPKSAGEGYYFVEDTFSEDNTGELFLNIIDANEVRFIPELLFHKSFEFINKYISNGKIIIHCNKGESRSTGIVIAYLNRYTDFFEDCDSLEEQLDKFKGIYPKMKLGNGIYEMVKHLYETHNLPK